MGNGCGTLGRGRHSAPPADGGPCRPLSSSEAPVRMAAARGRARGLVGGRPTAATEAVVRTARHLPAPDERSPLS